MHKYKHNFADGGSFSTSDPNVFESVLSVEAEMQLHAQITHKWLKDKFGVSGCHPDDGWVDREKNSVKPCYPNFWENVTVDSLVALGWSDDKFRIVRVTKINQWESKFGQKEYYFEEIKPEFRVKVEQGEVIKTEIDPPKLKVILSTTHTESAWTPVFYVGAMLLSVGAILMLICLTG